MTGTAPSGEKLYAALDELRQSDARTLVRHDGAWRAVTAFLRLEDPRGSEDARQETLINVLRSVHDFEGHSPGEAVRWVRTVHRNRTRDLWRVNQRDPVRDALERRRPDSEREVTAIERLAAPEPTRAPHAAAALARTRDAVFTRLEEQLTRERAGAAKHELRRLQARAAWLRLVQEQDAAAIEAALAPHQPASRDALYKWVERGRTVLLEVFGAWLAELREAGGEADARLVPEALLEIVGERRADAGVARPERRKH